MIGAAIALASAIGVGAPGTESMRDPVFVLAQPIADKPSVELDANQGHVLIRSDRQVPVLLMKEPTAEQQAEYDAWRARELAAEREKYARRKAAYDKAKAFAERNPGTLTPVPKRPIEPTEANFEFIPLPLLTMVAIGPQNRFAKTGGQSAYLHMLSPGRYRVYGLMAPMNGAALAHCFCMGSVSFEVKAGEVTDLGMIASARPTIEASSSAKALFAPASDSMLDPRLASAKIRPAVFRAAGKSPNFFGGAISRVPAMPGVIAYDRDRIIDLGGGGSE